jgi:poly-gamma-glutamate synthesis protein (capsule biosynthesis protein)
VAGDLLTLFLGGDVMTGRGVDQVLPHPGDPRLREGYVTDARTYVRLAEQANGPVPHPVDLAWPWGDALSALDEAAVDLRLINLETSITRSDDVAVGKAVHYRMAPENIGCLTAARPDLCSLANNHVLDFGPRGLADTTEALAAAGIAAAGAGSDLAAAARPAVLTVDDHRVVVAACGTGSSGIPDSWAATPGRPGVHLLPDLSATAADRLLETLDAANRPADTVVVSIHWGSNWGHQIPAAHIEFAHLLVDRGVDVVYGHSSHHPRPIEVYRDRLILYGCGDLIDDYEGITGYEEFRDDLRLLYLVSVAPDTGALVRLRMVPLQARRLRLHLASGEDTRYLQEVLDRTSARFGCRVSLAENGLLALVPAGRTTGGTGPA